MTYGEAWFKMKESIKLVNGEMVYNKYHHKPRMSRSEANIYYTNKLNKEFKRLGYVKKPTFQEEMDIAFIRVRKETNAIIRRGARQLAEVSR